MAAAAVASDAVGATTVAVLFELLPEVLVVAGPTVFVDSEEKEGSCFTGCCCCCCCSCFTVSCCWDDDDDIPLGVGGADGMEAASA